MKRLNIHGLLSQGYQVVQTGTTSFDLRDKTNGVICEFEVDSVEDSISFIYNRLLAELDYHIRSIESDCEEYFEYSNDDETTHIKGKFLTEIKLIAEILR